MAIPYKQTDPPQGRYRGYGGDNEQMPQPTCLKRIKSTDRRSVRSLRLRVPNIELTFHERHLRTNFSLKGDNVSGRCFVHLQAIPRGR